MMSNAPNRLFYGDCLTIMRDHLAMGEVDLVYLDPPFNSNRSYNAIYKDETGRPLPDQIEAFCDLWKSDPYQFQKWAVEEIDGFATTKRSADGGVDGRIYFRVPGKRMLQCMVIEVKGGRNVPIAHLRALLGVLENDRAMMAGLVVMDDLGAIQLRNFHQFMGQAGDVTIDHRPYPRLQLLTVREILDGKRFNTPGVSGRRQGQARLPGT